MADPTIQTFCCHHGNRTDMAVAIIEQFNTSAYNVVSIFSSTVGILGAIYQVCALNICCLHVCNIICQNCRFYQGINTQAITDGYLIQRNVVEE